MVFVVVRSFEIYQELQRLNGDSVCRWLSASPPSVDDSDDAHSISTIKTGSPVPDIGVLCLRSPRFSYEKTKAGLPTCFLFGRRSGPRKVDVYLGRNRQSEVSRVHFALGLKHGTWAIPGHW